jgi:hypothetical protein
MALSIHDLQKNPAFTDAIRDYAAYTYFMGTTPGNPAGSDTLKHGLKKNRIIACRTAELQP